MRHQQAVTGILAAVFLCAVARADVVVLVNRADSAADYGLHCEGVADRGGSLQPGELACFPVIAGAQLRLIQADSVSRYALKTNAAYSFVGPAGRVELRELQYGAPTEEPGPPPPAHWLTLQETVATLPVMIAVDDDEPAVQKVWQDRLRRRVAAVSEILERYLRVRLAVVAVGTWDSDDTITDIREAMREFEKERSPAPARVVIGFTSQFGAATDGNHLGVTRGPLHTHILIREGTARVRIHEPERTEILAHELGHFFGAAHCTETDSVMRPAIGDRQSLATGFAIRFDPLNTLVMAQVVDELRARNATGFADLPRPVRLRVAAAYRTIAESLPKDPAAGELLELLERAAETPPPPVRGASPLDLATRSVVQAIVSAAAHRPAGAPEGDALTDYYVCAAADAARKAPPELAPKAFALALGIALDSSTALRDNFLLGRLCRQAESDEQRTYRLGCLGQPTVQGRRDLCQHFAVSATLSAMLGPEMAETVGVMKELGDADGGSGFSFVDLGADLAGIELARRLLAGEIALDRLATEFRTVDFVPPSAGLREGLQRADFVREYGSARDERFRAARDALLQTIRDLPGHRQP